MRLTIEQQNQIKQTVTAMVDGPVEIYVFGSRVDVLLHAPSLLIQPIHRVALREGVKL